MSKSITKHIKLSHNNGEGDMELRISTSKGSRGYVNSHATVGYVKECSTGFTSFSYVLFQDYSKPIKPITVIQRATEKALITVHKETMMNIDAILNEIRTHYSLPELSVVV